MILPLLSLRLPHHVELPGAPLRLAHPVKVLQKHVDLLGAYYLVLWRQRPVVCGDVGLYTGLPARGAPRKTIFVFLVRQNHRRGGGALRRSKTKNQKNQNRAVETRRDETRDGVSQGTGLGPNEETNAAVPKVEQRPRRAFRRTHARPDLLLPWPCILCAEETRRSPSLSCCCLLEERTYVWTLWARGWKSLRRSETVGSR